VRLAPAAERASTGQSGRVAKFACRCGATIHTSGQIPNPQQWLLAADESLDRFVGPVDAEALYGLMLHAYRCDECARLWVFWKGYDAEPTEYLPQ
jgi:hypothetical protein